MDLNQDAPGLLEIVETLCDVAQKLVGIVRRQTALIEQEHTVDTAILEMTTQSREVMADFAKAERKLREVF